MARIAGKVSEVKYARADRRHTDGDGAHLRIARRRLNRAVRQSGRAMCRDCGEPGKMTGHQECQYPQDH